MGGSINQFRGRRLAAVLGALTLSLVGAVGGASPASAAAGDIDFDASGSIIIQKHVHQSGQTGSASGGDLSSPGVAEVKFTGYPITTLPLSLATSWTTLRTLKVPATACDGTASLAGQDLGTGIVSPATLSNGLTTIPDLRVAAYLLCETASPSTVVDKAQPFVVTIPYPRDSGTPTESWLYNVHVYPKNGVASVEKTVAPQSDLGLGAIASFPVTTGVPKIADNAYFTHFWVQDPMPSQLTPDAVTIVKLGSTDLVRGVDYLVSTVGQLVTVEFTKSGLVTLKNQAPKTLVTIFTGTVDSLGSGGNPGAISNRAYLSTATKVSDTPPTTSPASPESDPSDLKYPGNHDYPGTESLAVAQYWGDLSVTKFDAGDRLTGLAGAQFEVYEAAEPYPSTACSATPKAGESAIRVRDGATGTRRSLFTTTDGGLLKIDGLFVSDTGNGETKRCYVLREVAPPAGFILPTGGYEWTPVTVTTGVTNTASIYNTQMEGVVLPMTGSNGIVVMSVAGLGLIAAGIVLAFLARRRRQTA